MYLCPESKRDSGRRDYESRVFCSRVGTFVTWQVTARSYPSYRGLCSPRISSSRLFFRIRFVASYARMAWKVANYNALKSEADAMRVRYQNLQKVVSQTDKQLASLEIY